MITDVDAIKLNVNQALPTTLIVNELISNAFRHAFSANQDDPQLRITVKQTGNTVSVNLQDNGRGFPGEVLQHHKGSMGMTIISALVKQLEADLEISNTPGGTVHFTFRIESRRGSSSAHIH